MLARLHRLSAPVLSSIILVAAALLLLNTPLHAADQCAAPGGASGCYATIQAAVDAAGDGDTVRVAPGTYNETLLVTKTVTMLGGCEDLPGCGSRTLGDSTIDGLRASSVISVTNGAVPTIDGFTITGGDATTNGGNGGGINVWEASATIQNNTIEVNVASTNSGRRGRGGGIYAVNTTAPIHIRDNTIRNNSAYVATTEPSAKQYVLGGGICLAFDTEGVVENNTITDNVAVRAPAAFEETHGAGGGIGLQGVTNVLVRNNVVTGNIASKGIGVGQGGGLAAWGGDSVTVYGNEFVQNVALETGYDGFGGGIYTWETKLLTVTENLVQENRATQTGTNGQGGGIHVSLNPPESSATAVEDVMAQVSSSGELETVRAVVSDAVFVIRGNEVYTNTAVVNQTSIGYVGGGGLKLWAADQSLNATLILEDNAIAGNLGVTQIADMAGRGSDGGGASIQYFANAEIRNNIIRDNVFAQRATAVTGDADNYAGSLKGGGLAVYNSGAVLFEGNTVERNMTMGVLRGGGSNPSTFGGGVSFDNVLTSVLRSNMIVDNVAIGDLAPSLTSEWLAGHGGGVAVISWDDSTECTLQMEDNDVRNNRVAEKVEGTGSSQSNFRGGGVYIRGMQRVIAGGNELTGNVLSPMFNVAVTGDAAGDVQGGGLFVDASRTVSLTSNLVQGNIGVEDFSLTGAGAYLAGAGIKLYGIEEALLEDNTIRSNVVVDEGSIDGDEGDLALLVSAGMSTDCGGSCMLTLNRNRFVDNRVMNGFSFQGDAIAYFVAAAYDIANLTCNADSNRILRNRNYPGKGYGQNVVNVWKGTLNSVNDVYAFNSSALQSNSDDPANPGVISVVNGTLYNNETRGIETGGGTATVHNTIIVGHDEGLFAGNPGSITGDYNLMDNTTNYVNVAQGAHDLVGVKPQLVNPNNGNFHLDGGSPAIDRGLSSISPGHDFENDPRPMDGDRDGGRRVDIGADEFEPMPLTERTLLPAAIKEQ